ncbi:MAG: hypothetical protein ACFFB0_06240 [Promethearchaeota archaeon]
MSNKAATLTFRDAPNSFHCLAFSTVDQRVKLISTSRKSPKTFGYQYFTTIYSNFY